MKAGRKHRLTEADHDAWAGFTRHVAPLHDAPQHGAARHGTARHDALLARRASPSSGPSSTAGTSSTGGMSATGNASVNAAPPEKVGPAVNAGTTARTGSVINRGATAKKATAAKRSAPLSDGAPASGRIPQPVEATRALWDMAPPPTWRPPPPRSDSTARQGTAGAALTVGGPPGGVDKATWQRFRTGKLPASRKLDLHGMTAQRAFQALSAFLRGAHADGLRCVEIVTGRGNPLGSAYGGSSYEKNADGMGRPEGTGVIRREFPVWLNRPDIRPLVLGATHPQVVNPAHPHAANRAHPHAANTGAVRLLLRRPR